MAYLIKVLKLAGLCALALAILAALALTPGVGAVLLAGLSGV